MEVDCQDTWIYSYCDGVSGATTHCECESEFNSVRYELTGVELLVACPIAAGLCSSSAGIDFPEPVCAVSWAEGDANYCDVEFECTSEVPLTPDITATATEWRSSWCGANPDGSWGCECYGAGLSRVFEIGPEFAPDACAVATTVCTTDEIVDVGELSCEVNYQSVSPGWCEAGLTCGHAATLGGVPVTIQESRRAYCDQIDTALWSCQCDPSSGVARFEVEDADPWLGCQAAARTCSQSMSLE